MKREGRLKFILVSVFIAELSLVLFGCLPRPLNVLALFFNGLSLDVCGVLFLVSWKGGGYRFVGLSFRIEHCSE